MLDTITNIFIIVCLIWFVQWLSYRERKDYKEFLQWRKHHPGDTVIEVEQQPKSEPPADDPNIILLEEYRKAK